MVDLGRLQVARGWHLSRSVWKLPRRTSNRDPDSPKFEIMPLWFYSVPSNRTTLPYNFRNSHLLVQTTYMSTLLLRCGSRVDNKCMICRLAWKTTEQTDNFYSFIIILLRVIKKITTRLCLTALKFWQYNKHITKIFIIRSKLNFFVFEFKKYNWIFVLEVLLRSKCNTFKLLKYLSLFKIV